MKRIFAPLAALALCSLLWAGCASKTPKAEVPPPPPQPAKAATPSATETQPWSDKEHVRAQSPSARAAMAEETIVRFKSAYPAAGSPSLVLLFNQQPAGDLRTESSSDQTAMWAVENGFLQPFLKAGATIKHGTTAVSPPKPVTDKPEEISQATGEKPEESIQTTETEASEPKPEPMKGPADLVIDLNVAPLPQYDAGYAIRATAREVDSGVIIGHAAGSTQMSGKKAVPTKTGYQFKEAGTQSAPLDLVARGVAVDLMNSLMEKWTAASPSAVQPESAPAPSQ